MSTNSLLLDNEKRETFDLGSGPWYLIFSYIRNSKITDGMKSPEDLAEKIYNEVLTIDKEYDFEEVQVIANKIWIWGQDRTLFFGNDIGDVWNDKLENLHWWECNQTGTRYG